MLAEKKSRDDLIRELFQATSTEQDVKEGTNTFDEGTGTWFNKNAPEQVKMLRSLTYFEQEADKLRGSQIKRTMDIVEHYMVAANAIRAQLESMNKTN